MLGELQSLRRDFRSARLHGWCECWRWLHRLGLRVGLGLGLVRQFAGQHARFCSASMTQSCRVISALRQARTLRQADLLCLFGCGGIGVCSIKELMESDATGGGHVGCVRDDG